MPQGNPTELIYDIENYYFQGQFLLIKSQVIDKNKELDRIGQAETLHWLDGVHWRTYLNTTPTVSGGKLDTDEFEMRKGSVLSCLARIVIEMTENQVKLETNPNLKAQWWKQLEYYLNRNNNKKELAVYNDDGSSIKDYKSIIDYIKTEGTKTPIPKPTTTEGDDILKRDWVWERHKWVIENYSNIPQSRIKTSKTGGSSIASIKDAAIRISGVLESSIIAAQEKLDGKKSYESTDTKESIEKWRDACQAVKDYLDDKVAKTYTS